MVDSPVSNSLRLPNQQLSASSYTSKSPTHSQLSHRTQNSNSLLSLLAASEEASDEEDQQQGQKKAPPKKTKDDAFYGAVHNKNALTKLQVSLLTMSLLTLHVPALGRDLLRCGVDQHALLRGPGRSLLLRHQLRRPPGLPPQDRSSQGQVS